MAERASKIRKPPSCREGTKQSRGRSVTKTLIMGKGVQSRHEVLRGLGRCREARRAPRSKERCVARGRQVAGKAPCGWGGETYPADAMTRSPPSTKTKLSSQDSNGQPEEPRIAHSALAIQKVYLLRGERRVIRRAPRIQEGAE